MEHNCIVLPDKCTFCIKSRETGLNEHYNVKVAAKIGLQNVQFPELTSRGLTDTRFLITLIRDTCRNMKIITHSNGCLLYKLIHFNSNEFMFV